MPLAPPLILSASRRTDLPAFHAEWLRRRLRHGWCETVNPFSGRASRVSLAPADVLAWVFWSRNYTPFLDVLDTLWTSGRRFICHCTINAMPSSLEPRTIEPDTAVATAHHIAKTFDPRALLWRYDPILLTSDTPPEWHRQNFLRLARALQGATHRCIFSFPTMYRKTLRNLARLQAQPGGPRLWTKANGDFSTQDLQTLARDLAQIAAAHHIQMHVCCGAPWADPDAGIQPAACIDWPLLQKLGAGQHLTDTPQHDLIGPNAPPVPRRPSRPGCGCWQSLDIGAYGTCAHGCAYCYAVDDPQAASRQTPTRDPDSPRL